MPETDELLRTKDAAALISEGVRKFIRRVERGEITPAMKLDGIRGAYLFNRSDVEALLTTPVAATPQVTRSNGSSSSSAEDVA